MSRFYKSNGNYVEEITIEQIRNDAIDEYKKELQKEHFGIVEHMLIETIAERVKEHTNERV